MEFMPWPKTARLFRTVTVTEKLDGTNAAIRIQPLSAEPNRNDTYHGFVWVQTRNDGVVEVGAQSRNRLITPTDDNYGFAAWVAANAESLVTDLGIGAHFGEWWGQGIQRGYGLSEKRFSLFNTAKWGDAEFETPQLHTVPILYEGPFRQSEVIDGTCMTLRSLGSLAAPGFQDPEGICIFHSQSRKVYKYTLDGDGHKG